MFFSVSLAKTVLKIQKVPSGQSVLYVEEAWNIRNNSGLGNDKIWI